MTRSAQSASPWGEPAPAVSTSIRSGSVDGARPAASSPSPGRAAAAAALANRPHRRKRAPVLEERSILVRIIPRTGVFARVRAAFALIVIAVAVGLVAAGTLSVIVWGIASAIHHAAAN